MNDEHLLQQGMETNDKLDTLVASSDHQLVATTDVISELKDLNKTMEDILVQESDKEDTKQWETLQDSLKNIVEVISAGKTDLTPLSSNFAQLEASVKAVVSAIKEIPKDKEIDLSGVEKLLTNLVNKETKEAKEIDLSELKNISTILDSVLYAVQTLASKSDEKIEVSLKFV